jgi:hypothetical protein
MSSQMVGLKQAKCSEQGCNFVASFYDKTSRI